MSNAKHYNAATSKRRPKSHGAEFERLRELVRLHGTRKAYRILRSRAGLRRKYGNATGGQLRRTIHASGATPNSLCRHSVITPHRPNYESQDNGTLEPVARTVKRTTVKRNTGLPIGEVYRRWAASPQYRKDVMERIDAANAAE